MTIVPLCVKVTSAGLPVAPLAVIRIVPVRILVVALILHVIVPLSVPDDGLIVTHSLPGITAAVHGMVPLPVLEMLKVVVPPDNRTVRFFGVTDSTDGSVPSCVTVTYTGAFGALSAEILISPVRVTFVAS